MIIDVLLRDKEAQCDTAQKLMARTMISGQDQTIKSNQGLSVEISGVVHIDRAYLPPLSSHGHLDSVTMAGGYQIFPASCWH